MNLPSPSSTLASLTPSTTLGGRSLTFARAAWLAVAALTVTLFVMAVPLHYAQLQKVCVGAACADPQLTLDDVRELQALGLSRDFHATYHITLEVGFALVHFVIATLIFARKSDDRMALFVSLMLLTFGAATFTGTMDALTGGYSIWRLPVAVVSPLPAALPEWLWNPLAAWRLPVAFISSLGQAFAALFFYLFPDGRFVPRWTRALAAVWVVWQVPAIFFSNSPFNSDTWPPLLAGAVWSVFLGSYVFAQVYRFRRVSDPVQRQQTKWVVFGVTGALGGILGAILLSGIFSMVGRPSLLYRGAITTVIYLSMLLIPLSIGVAILRSRLWAIDIIINRTLVYGILTGLLALIYVVSVVVLQQAFRTMTGPRSNLAIVISTLAIAALFNPLRRRVQDRVDLRFYRRKYDAAQTLAAFSATLRDGAHADLDTLTADLVAVVQQTMQPAHISLWLKPPTKKKSERGE
jgi:hypothetical protein